jgi:spermidine synthase
MMWLDLAITVFAAALLLGLGLLRGVASDWLVQAATFALVAVAGVLGGLVFPLASVIVLEARPSNSRPSVGQSGAGAAAASVDAADNAGACLGALLTGVLLVPILGAAGACAVVLGVKALSGLLVGIAAAVRPRPTLPPSPSPSV